MKNRRRKTIQFAIVALIGLLLILVTFLIWKREYFSFKTFKHPRDRYTIQYPKNWEASEKVNYVSAIFLSPLENDLDVFRENVNIVIQDLSETPLDGNLAKYTDVAIGQMQNAFKQNLMVVESRPMTLSGLPAYKFVYIGKNPGAPDIKNLHVWTIDGHKAYQISYTAMRESFDKYLPQVRIMIKSFKITR